MKAREQEMTNTKQAQRTPGPWHLNWSNGENIVRTIETDRALEVAIMTTGDFGDPTELANARSIVRACNAHDDLIAVARRCDELLSVICATNHPPKTSIALITDLRTAIAKAEAS